ncbi:MAG: hypothetical protein L0H70_04915 [Xanthomonadales bacterium]|nr:hypothetical protein [Xanthomonadales bacterium]
MIAYRYLPMCLFALLAVALLMMTLFWQIPMMLWDHLNLVPMLEAWQQGQLAHSAIFKFDGHGGHMHTAAYAILLVDAQLTSGRPWLDGVISWALLVASAALLFGFIRDSFSEATRGQHPWLVAMLVCLALYPGHLANLQWGWQVAVFLCLLGVIGAIHALTRPRLSWSNNGIALVGAALAFFSFATAIAIFPIALLLLALHRDESLRKRMLMALPWVVACIALVAVYLRFMSASMAHDIPTEIHYGLNFLGAGISRFATDTAACLAIAGITLAGWLAWRQWRTLDSLPWIGRMLFGLLSGMLVTLARASDWGADQAFASRYVSFSILFWLGLFALLSRAYMACASRRLLAALVVISVFACGNAFQLIHRAQKVSARTHATASTIRATWPHVNSTILNKIYFGNAPVAYQRLGKLHAWGYAPFGDKSVPTPPDHRDPK